MAPRSPDSGTPPEHTRNHRLTERGAAHHGPRRLVFTPRASYILPVDERILPLLPLPIVTCPGTAGPSGHAAGLYMRFARRVRALS